MILMVAIFVYLLATVFIPFTLIFISYGDLGEKLIGLYRHLYIYPFLFGVPFIIFAFKFLRSFLKSDILKGFKSQFWIVVAILCSAYAVVELKGQPGFSELSLTYLEEPRNYQTSQGATHTFTLKEQILSPQPDQASKVSELLPPHSYLFWGPDVSIAKWGYFYHFQCRLL